MANNPMFSFKKAMAKSLLSAKEIERLALAALYNADNTKVDWGVCASESGSTKESFRVMFNGTLAKLRKNNCYIDGTDDDDDDAGEGGAVAAPTPKKKTGGGRKRKTSNDDNDSFSAPSPSKKSRGRGKKIKTEVVEEPGTPTIEADEELKLEEFVDAEMFADGTMSSTG